MLLGALLLALLNPVPPPVPVNVRTECLKTCAGAPKDAKGAALLQCLERCAPSSTDGGVR
jgi:hypothetical protein